VLLTDLALQLPLTGLNAAANVGPIRSARGGAACAQLPWGETEGVFAPAPTDVAKAVPLLDEGGRIVPPFALVTASEVAYRAEMFPLLLTTLCALCGVGATGGTSPPSAVLLAARYRACCELNDFLCLLATRFTVACLVSGGHEADLPACVALPPASADGAGGGPAGAGAPKPAGSKRAGRGAGMAPSTSSPTDIGAALLCMGEAASGQLRRFSAAAKALSKTAYAPMLFVLLPRRDAAVG
jgi:hypothetical protein